MGANIGTTVTAWLVSWLGESISHILSRRNIHKKEFDEETIRSLRNYLRDTEIENIEVGKKNYQTSVYFMDVVSELEKMGDFMINISQDLEKAFLKK